MDLPERKAAKRVPPQWGRDRVLEDALHWIAAYGSLADSRKAREALDTADRGAVSADAEHGRALVDRMFEIPRPSPEWEQALADLRVWSMERPSTNPGAVDASYDT